MSARYRALLGIAIAIGLSIAFILRDGAMGVFWGGIILGAYIGHSTAEYQFVEHPRGEA